MKNRNKNVCTGKEKIDMLYTNALTCTPEKFYINLKNLAREIIKYPDPSSFELFLHLTDNYKGRLEAAELTEVAGMICSPGGMAEKAALKSGVKTAKRILDTADEMAGGAAFKDPKLSERSAEIKYQCSEMKKKVAKLHLYGYISDLRSTITNIKTSSVHIAQKHKK